MRQSVAAPRQMKTSFCCLLDPAGGSGGPGYASGGVRNAELLRITGQVLESARQVVKKAAKVKRRRRARPRGECLRDRSPTME